MRNMELEIHGRNELKRLLLVELNNIYPQLEKFVGHRISTQTGKSAKFNISFLRTKPNSFTDCDYSQNHVTYLKDSGSSLWLYLKICLNGGKYENKTYYCDYFDEEIYIGKVENHILTSLDSLNDIINRSDLNMVINIDEEKEKIKKYKTLKTELESLKRSIKINEEFYRY